MLLLQNHTPTLVSDQENTSTGQSDQSNSSVEVLSSWQPKLGTTYRNCSLHPRPRNTKKKQSSACQTTGLAIFKGQGCLQSYTFLSQMKASTFQQPSLQISTTAQTTSTLSWGFCDTVKVNCRISSYMRIAPPTQKVRWSPCISLCCLNITVYTESTQELCAAGL